MRIWIISAMSAIMLVAGCNQRRALVPSARPQVDVSGLEARAVRIVRDGLDDPEALVRNHSIEVVATTQRRELMPKVVSLLGDSMVPVRFAAAAAIGDLRYSAGEYPVRALLEDPDANVQIAAAYALTRLGKTEYARRIRTAVRSDDQTVRANAVLLLGKLGDKKNLPTVYEALRDDTSTDKVKFQAVESIAMLGDAKIYDRLWALLISKFADDRVMGIRGMAALNTPEAENAIVTMLGNEVMEVRLCAAEALGRLGNTAGEAEVIAYFDKARPNLDETSVANTFATMAIGRIGTDGLKKYLPRLLESRSPVVRLGAAQSVLLLSGGE
ncbi:MAG TPA: HEAT repeat domain-containing protein [Anaerohalosphaeraceae bacterium]|jgi:HEAT repeat protein|nr:HEAT repeat domain-containing protein [Anaerohalosphaeraceae bacterium]HRT52386.1 HEAT repeat domain-containing protein [Anaerohalosphaeraceae bacterium]HRT88432.1 HEAT repeat domain-containing protein [Anaerohalosphaeraceae bacterium]